MAVGSLPAVRRSVVLRLLTCVLLVGTLLANVHPARAAFDWASGDPVFTFRHRGLLSTYIMDVQVQVPLSALPISGPAQLHVITPSNVETVSVNLPLPPFPIDIDVDATGPATPDASYPVNMTLVVPRTTTAFPIRLLVTDPLGIDVSIFEGTAGRPLRATVDVR